MTFLILRCKASDTLVQAESLREYHEKLGIEQEDVKCPTCTVTRRVGRSRDRIEEPAALMGSFVFVRWNGSLSWANYIEYKFPFLKLMRLPHGGYATCSEAEVLSIGLPPPAQEPAVAEAVPPPAPIMWALGTEVVINTDGFLKGVTGIVKRCKNNGEVSLKILDSRGWKLSTLQIHGSLLLVKGASL